MSTQRHIPAFSWAHCWNTPFFKRSMRENTREVRVFTLKVLPSSLAASLLPLLYLLLPSNAKGTFVWLSHLSPSPLLVVPLSQRDKSVCDFPWLFVPLSPSIPFISLFCNPWQLRRMPKPALSLGTLRWAGLPLHLSAQCEQHNQLCYHLH